MTSGGSWSNPQYVAEAVDPTGLTFTASYSDGTTASVSPQSHSPSTWGDTVGTQTCTFSYTEDEVTVTCDIDANVQAAPGELTVTSVAISGTPTNAQQLGHYIDWTGCTFTYGLSDGTTLVRTDNEGVYNEATDTALALESGDGLDGNNQWVDLSETLVTVTAYGEDDGWFAENGYAVADPAPSATFDFAQPVVIPTITSVSVSGEQLNCNVQAGRFRPKGLIFSFTADNGDVITTASSETATGEVDYNWTRSDAKADQGCAITIDDITGDPTSIVTYEASSSYFMGVGSVALTVRPNPECECFGGYDIDPNASTTLNLNVINNYHLVGSIDDSLQIEGQAPDLTGATLYAYSSGADKDPQTGLPTSNGNQISNPEFDPTVYSTTGTQTLAIRASNVSTWGPVPMTTTVDVQAGTPIPTVTSLTISGTLTGTNTEGDYPDFSGITWTYGLDNGQTVVKTAQDYNDQFSTQVFFTMDSCAGYDNEYKWASGSAGTQTVTFDCAGGSSPNWWTQNGYAVASPEPTATLQVTVQAAQ